MYRNVFGTYLIGRPNAPLVVIWRAYNNGAQRVYVRLRGPGIRCGAYRFAVRIHRFMVGFG